MINTYCAQFPVMFHQLNRHAFLLPRASFPFIRFTFKDFSLLFFTFGSPFSLSFVFRAFSCELLQQFLGNPFPCSYFTTVLRPSWSFKRTLQVSFLLLPL